MVSVNASAHQYRLGPAYPVGIEATAAAQARHDNLGVCRTSSVEPSQLWSGYSSPHRHPGPAGTGSAD